MVLKLVFLPPLNPLNEKRRWHRKTTVPREGTRRVVLSDKRRWKKNKTGTSQLQPNALPKSYTWGVYHPQDSILEEIEWTTEFIITCLFISQLNAELNQEQLTIHTEISFSRYTAKQIYVPRNYYFSSQLLTVLVYTAFFKLSKGKRQ